MNTIPITANGLTWNIPVPHPGCCNTSDPQHLCAKCRAAAEQAAQEAGRMDQLASGLELLASDAREFQHFTACYGPAPVANGQEFGPASARPMRTDCERLQRQVDFLNEEVAARADYWLSANSLAEQIPYVPPPLTANQAADVSFLEEARAGVRLLPCDQPSRPVCNYHLAQDAEVSAARASIYRAMDGEPVRLF